MQTFHLVVYGRPRWGEEVLQLWPFYLPTRGSCWHMWDAATGFCSHAEFAVSHDFSSHVSMCLFIWAHILNMRPLRPSSPPLFSDQGETVKNGPSSPLRMETSLLFWYADKSDDSFWRGDTLAGVLRDVQDGPGFTITPPSQGQVSSRGASDVVISWDVRDWLPQGWKCNKTDNSNKRWRKYRLELSYKRSRMLPAALI